MLPLYGIEACNVFFAKLKKGGLLRLFSLYSSGNFPARIHFTYDT